MAEMNFLVFAKAFRDALSEAIAASENGHSAAPVQTKSAPTTPPPSAPSGVPLAEDIKSNMTKEAAAAYVAQHRLDVAASPDNETTKDYKQRIKDAINKLNAPGGQLPAQPQQQLFQQPAAAPVVAQPQPAPAVQQPQVQQPVQQFQPQPVVAQPMQPQAFVPPGQQPAPAVQPAAPAAAPDAAELPAKNAQFVAMVKAKHGNELYNYWTQTQWNAASELQQMLNGALGDANMAAEKKQLIQQFGQRMGCQLQCTTGCPFGPAQAALCHGIFDTDLPYTYGDVATKGRRFCTQPVAKEKWVQQTGTPEDIAKIVEMPSA